MKRRTEGQIITFKGKRGTVYRARYRDADGRRVCETLRDATTMKEAEQRLGDLLSDVRREGRRKLQPRTLRVFAEEWLATYPETKGLKRSTIESYTGIINRHLIPALGSHRLEAIDVARLDDYVAAKLRAGFGPRTINRHLNLLHELFKAAKKRKLVRDNPVSDVDRPKEPDNSWTILSPVEIGRVERGFRELADEAEGEERTWREQARVVFLTVLGAGLRRGEILGLRWRAVSLTDPDGPRLAVEETWVRSGIDTPKSKAGRRSVDLGGVVADALFEHRGRTAFEGDDERVFCSPNTGGPLDPKRYAETLKLALAKAKVEKPMRPFHDGRHTSITNGAAAGLAPAVLMARAGHSDFATTQLYIDLAGVRFREEAEKLDDRVFAAVGHNSGQN